ncbi:MAG: GvpL/GvpF family gas vesicle protein [Pseudomonadota bacterium]
METIREGKYIYCIIGTRQDRNFGPIGAGGRGDEVLTIGYDDLSMVVSSHPMARIAVNRENMLAHEKVIEEVMKEFDSVLPVRFGTIAASADEIRNLLGRRRREFQNLLRDMDNKVELGVKGVWTDMNGVFKEITDERRDIRKFKEKIQKAGGGENMQDKVKIGKMVERVLAGKKKEEAEKIADALRPAAVDYKMNTTADDRMFMNASFLVDRGREKEFDNIMDDLGERCADRIKFMYAGPLPPFNFVNIVIYPEEWET